MLAGGKGTRLGKKTQDIPKPMLPIGGRPFLARLMDYWIGQGVRHFVLAVGYRHSVVHDYFGDRYESASLEYSFETALLGTGGGLLLAQEKLKSQDAFLVLNGDTFFEVALQDMRRYHQAKQAIATLALATVTDAARYEKIEIAADGRILAFMPRGIGKSAAQINGGVYLLNRGWHIGLGHSAGEPASLEQELFPALLKSGRPVYGFAAGARFLDIGTPEDFKKAAEFFNSGKQ